MNLSNYCSTEFCMPNRTSSSKMFRLVFPIAVLFQYVSTFFPLRNNVPLESGDKYSFNEDGSEMTILDVTKLDEGDYTCIAKNKAGESEQELSLKVFGKNSREMLRSLAGI